MRWGSIVFGPDESNYILFRLHHVDPPEFSSKYLPPILTLICCFVVLLTQCFVGNIGWILSNNHIFRKCEAATIAVCNKIPFLCLCLQMLNKVMVVDSASPNKLNCLFITPSRFWGARCCLVILFSLLQIYHRNFRSLCVDACRELRDFLFMLL